MAAYVVANVHVHDPVRYEEYRRGVASSLKPHGGTFLVRGGAAEVLEGSVTPRRFVVIRFPSLADAQAWWTSDSYTALKAIRHATASSDVLLVEGI